MDLSSFFRPALYMAVFIVGVSSLYVCACLIKRRQKRALNRMNSRENNHSVSGIIAEILQRRPHDPSNFHSSSSTSSTLSVFNETEMAVCPPKYEDAIKTSPESPPSYYELYGETRSSPSHGP